MALRCRALAKQVLPPIVISAFRKLVRRSNEARPDHCEWRQVSAGPLRGTWLELDEAAAKWTGRMGRGDFEVPTASVLEATIKPGWTCFDIGAHVGYHSLLMAKLVGPTGAVHAFEPLPQNIERINRHVARNDQGKIVHVHPLAISDCTGAGTMRGTDRLATSSGGYLASARPSASTRTVAGYRDVPIEQETLDRFLSRSQVAGPNLIKMDVEGAEVAALRGATELLRKWKPFLIVEFHNATNAVEGMQLLHHAGYETSLIESCAETCSITAQFRDNVVCK